MSTLRTDPRAGSAGDAVPGTSRPTAVSRLFTSVILAAQNGATLEAFNPIGPLLALLAAIGMTAGGALARRATGGDHTAVKTIGLVVMLALAVLSAPFVADAQPPPKIPRIGILAHSSPAFGAPHVEAFRQGLRDLGYADVVIEARWAEGRFERLPDLAAELVRLKVDVIVSFGTSGPLAAKRATSTIPIVMVGAGDPVATGLVASLARPGGNVTGITIGAPEVGGKRLQLLKEAVPGLSRVAILWNAANPDSSLEVRATEGAARTLGIELQSLGVRAPGDFEGAFAAAITRHAGALMTVEDPLIIIHRAPIADFVARSRLPTIYGARELVEASGLMAYGPSSADAFRTTLSYVDRILKGAKAADLPVRLPRRFELIINLKTATALGLTIPQSLLLQADHVIQ